jgi:hypothetical protein
VPQLHWIVRLIFILAEGGRPFSHTIHHPTFAGENAAFAAFS